MSKKTLNKTNLEALGAERLADLLIEVSTGSADIKRRLRLELSHNVSASELAYEVQKRLLSLRKSTSYVSWRKHKALIKDLETQRAMILDKIAPEDAQTAFDLLWQFIEIAQFLFKRVDDSKGDISAVFQQALDQFQGIGPRAGLDPIALADRIWTVVQANDHGEWDGIISALAPTLGAVGLGQLKTHVMALADTGPEPENGTHEAIQFLRQLRGGANHGAERKARFVKLCLQEIAAATGDTQAYIAQYSAKDLARKDVAAEVASLLLSQDKADAALKVVLAAQRDGRTLAHPAWDAAYISCLLALGRQEDAQNHRWTSFSETLNEQHLREYLKLLPDFDDVEAEDRAKRHVLAFPDTIAGLDFCLKWPDMVTAQQLVETRVDEIEATQYALLVPVADSLRTRYPRAAVLLWRLMIGDILDNARTIHYGRAADHLCDCLALDAEIDDYTPFPSHDRYLAALRARHDRKASFWAKLR